MLIAHATNNAVLRIYGTSLAELTFRHIQHVPFAREEMEAGAAACKAIVASIESGDGRRTEYRIARHLEAVKTGIALRAWPLSQRPAEPVGTLNRLTETSDLL
jgi:DNA-binding FadR family transcriptional regulator